MPRPWPYTPTWTIPWGGGGVAGRRTGPYIHIYTCIHIYIHIIIYIYAHIYIYIPGLLDIDQVEMARCPSTRGVWCNSAGRLPLASASCAHTSTVARMCAWIASWWARRALNGSKKVLFYMCLHGFQGFFQGFSRCFQAFRCLLTEFLRGFQMPEAIYVQLDMPLKPLWADWIRPDVDL